MTRLKRFEHEHFEILILLQISIFSVCGRRSLHVKPKESQVPHKIIPTQTHKSRDSSSFRQGASLQFQIINTLLQTWPVRIPILYASIDFSTKVAKTFPGSCGHSVSCSR